VRPLRKGETRVTFLANVWLNYRPVGLQRFPQQELKHFCVTLASGPNILFQAKAKTKATVVKKTEQRLDSAFGGESGCQHLVHLALPKAPKDAGASLHLRFNSGVAGLEANVEPAKKKKKGKH